MGAEAPRQDKNLQKGLTVTVGRARATPQMRLYWWVGPWVAGLGGVAAPPQGVQAPPPSPLFLLFFLVS